MQINNLSIHNKKDVRIINLFLVILNLIWASSFNNTYKVDILLCIINLNAIFVFYRENPKKSIVAFAFSYDIRIPIVNSGELIYKKLIQYILKKTNDA